MHVTFSDAWGWHRSMTCRSQLCCTTSRLTTEYKTKSVRQPTISASGYILPQLIISFIRPRSMPQPACNFKSNDPRVAGCHLLSHGAGTDSSYVSPLNQPGRCLIQVPKAFCKSSGRLQQLTFPPAVPKEDIQTCADAAFELAFKGSTLRTRDICCAMLLRSLPPSHTALLCVPAMMTDRHSSHACNTLQPGKTPS